MATPIFLKPHLDDAGCFKQQMEDVENYFQPAFERAGLKFPGQEQNGISISDGKISALMVEHIFNADLVIVDVNDYSDTHAFPWLYYCVGLGQSLRNHTILVARSLDHLPVSLRTQHALSYDTLRPVVFLKSFEQAVRSILDGETNEPDNPIQEYLRHKKLESELQKLKMEAQSKDAQIKELEKRSKVDQKSSTSIIFRKVNP